jgi:hypothetical protein
MMQTGLANSLRAAGIIVLLAGVASAGPLPSDPNAIPGWQGSTPFAATLGSTTLSATIDYAVYAPGQIDTSVALGFPGHVPFDPSGGTNYVYAYEIFNTGAVAGISAKALTLSVGIDYLAGAVPTSSSSIGHDPLTPAGGVSPTGAQAAIFSPSIPPIQSARWSWASSGGLLVGANSDILIFSSPFGPKMYQSTLSGTGGTQTPNAPQFVLPSPIPEPTTAVLAAVGAGCLFGVARSVRRRNRVR